MPNPKPSLSSNFYFYSISITLNNSRLLAYFSLIYSAYIQLPQYIYIKYTNLNDEIKKENTTKKSTMARTLVLR